MERRVDGLGRIVIPVEQKRLLGIQGGEEVYVGKSGDCVYVSKDKVTDFIKRKIDALGRLSIPKEYCRELSIVPGAVVSCELDYDVVRISRSKVFCIMCGSGKEIRNVKGIRLCDCCIDEIGNGIFTLVEEVK